ncbi:tRNA pseudouridine(55) synthase TruB [Hymenobacter elongatus]|uniref:tRNA pseudouridine synthase B n=1 Tax=Hymenobacter elongatus TaxID=877208 RepID=A0A4Z0PKT0_9BACT|nr:tRNA pseudouridine(55) synthase TruB [Hymenobacter elongatus]TGE16282.1 tRNA pseudouridine(55) synthase TruB [Hymenobacter elongatus]
MSEDLLPRTFDFEAGEILLLDKPLTWTSFDVVRKVKNTLRIKKIGHAGTLDPLATGLLILCTGKLTKQIDLIQAQEKEYTGTFRLGQTTPSFDLETPVDAELPFEHLTPEALHAAAEAFTGLLQQTPPLYSAVKVNGERAYELARRGDTAEIKSKEVTIKVFELTSIALPEVQFRVVCTKGTYIRSLARDFGQHLGCGAHLSALVRTRIGDYHVADALSLEAVQALRPPRPAGAADTDEARPPHPNRNKPRRRIQAYVAPAADSPSPDSSSDAGIS